MSVRGGGLAALGTSTDSARYVAFWERVDRSGSCWYWTGHVSDTGYGQVSVGGRVKKAHRVAWEATHGPIPAGMRVLHRCDVRHCVNPDHLWLGTSADNTADMDAKGRRTHRQPRNTRLTAHEVAAIRRLHAAGVTQAELARSFDVTPIAIWKVVHRHTWREVVA